LPGYFDTNHTPHSYRQWLKLKIIIACKSSFTVGVSPFWLPLSPFTSESISARSILLEKKQAGNLISYLKKKKPIKIWLKINILNFWCWVPSGPIISMICWELQQICCFIPNRNVSKDFNRTYILIGLPIKQLPTIQCAFFTSFSQIIWDNRSVKILNINLAPSNSI